MKIKSLLFWGILVIMGLVSCNNDDDSTNGNDDDKPIELVGSWKLIEVLNDPGDGSGVFVSVTSDKVITFKNDGTLTSNGRLCDNSINSNEPTSGTYSKSESIFSSFDCFDSKHKFSFEQKEDVLIVHFQCIEGCSAKYIKE